MKTKNLNYLRSYRLRWGLSQGELAYLLGWSRSEVISRIEMKQRAPSLKLVIACFVLFGVPVTELFPDLSSGIEAEVIARVWEFYEKIQGDPTKRTKKQIELLEGVIERYEQRTSKPDV
jgi:DNA-binding XRE family transcriptional regulator